VKFATNNSTLTISYLLVLLRHSAQYKYNIMTKTIHNFAIIHKDDPKEALKHLTIPGDSEAVALSFAEDSLNEYKEGLQLTAEDFE